MPDTAIACVIEISWNEPKKFIFIDHRGCTTGDFEITGVDRDADDSNKNLSPQNIPKTFHAIEDT